jgi:hypothetical protein
MPFVEGVSWQVDEILKKVVDLDTFGVS